MLTTLFLNKKFSNPLVLASGILGVTGASLARAVENGCGGVTTKSISLTARTGHPNPTMIGTEHYFLNAVGLSNPGIEDAIPELIKYKTLNQAPLVGSIFAGTPEEFGAITKKICTAPIDFLEINLSCPNVSQEFGEPFAYSENAIQKITSLVKEKSKVPVIVKLAPQAWNISALSQAAVAGGADALNIGNTVSGMAIDTESGRPILANIQGGVSGPAIFPIALKAVYDTYKSVRVPIIGTGGVTSGTDAIAMLMAGATLIGVGSAIYYRGHNACQQIAQEIKEWLTNHNQLSLAELVGLTHK